MSAHPVFIAFRLLVGSSPGTCQYHRYTPTSVFIAFRLLVGSSHATYFGEFKTLAVFIAFRLLVGSSPDGLNRGSETCRKSSLPFGCWSVLHEGVFIALGTKGTGLHCLSAVGRFFTTSQQRDRLMTRPGLHCLSAVGRFFTSRRRAAPLLGERVFIAFRLLVGSSRHFIERKEQLVEAVFIAFRLLVGSSRNQ